MKKDEQEGDDFPFCFLGTEYLWKALKETPNKRRHSGWIFSWCVHAWRKKHPFFLHLEQASGLLDGCLMQPLKLTGAPSGRRNNLLSNILYT
ncbi:hypothetical protein [Peribacillus sp. NPDC096448]|uniref:hypothetical protein n=1 Tax=Peribacillus sp. NPDC096448 TaxID=3364395 RepID=UPI0037FD97D6